MLFGPGISLTFSGCKYILPLPLSSSTSTSLHLRVRVWGKPQGLSAASSLKASFHFQDRAGLQYGHCLYTNVALGIMFISITVLEGEEKTNKNAELVCTHCFSWNNASPGVLWRNGYFSNQPQVIHQQLSSLALLPSSDTWSCWEETWEAKVRQPRRIVSGAFSRCSFKLLRSLEYGL